MERTRCEDGGWRNARARAWLGREAAACRCRQGAVHWRCACRRLGSGSSGSGGGGGGSGGSGGRSSGGSSNVRMFARSEVAVSSLDGDGQVAAVRGEDVLPPLLVELAGAHVVVEDLLGYVNFLLGHHRAAEVALDKVLEAKEANLVELAAARLKVLRREGGERGRDWAPVAQGGCVRQDDRGVPATSAREGGDTSLSGQRRRSKRRTQALARAGDRKSVV